MKKFLSIMLFIATLLASFHHHNDLKTHNDCPICVLQSNFSSADTPTKFSLEKIEFEFIPIILTFISVILSKRAKYIFSRAPPLL